MEGENRKGAVHRRKGTTMIARWIAAHPALTVIATGAYLIATGIRRARAH